MKLKAVDTLHISELRSDAFRRGEVFEVSDEHGKDLVDRGLAEPVSEPAKAEPARRGRKPKV